MLTPIQVKQLLSIREVIMNRYMPTLKRVPLVALLLMGALIFALSLCACTSQQEEPIEKPDPEQAIEAPQEEAPQEPDQEKTIEVVLSNIYTTQFATVNQITYPAFTFNYPDNWTISLADVPVGGVISEQVTLTNERGVNIEYVQMMSNPGGTGSFAHKAEITKVADSQFIPGYVQSQDHSGLGSFMVARVKIIGEMEAGVEAEYRSISGTETFAVLPESWAGIREDLRGLNMVALSFDYSSLISLTCSIPDGGLTVSEEQEIIAIMSSFRVA